LITDQFINEVVNMIFILLEAATTFIATITGRAANNLYNNLKPLCSFDKLFDVISVISNIQSGAINYGQQ